MKELSQITTDDLARAVVRVAQNADREGLEGLYRPWEELKNDPDEGSIFEMEERYRMTEMPLPKTMGNVIPNVFVYTDYTEVEIVEVKKNGYMPMDELQGYKPFTTNQMQGAIKDVFENNLSGMMLSASAGWGKSTVYEYFGAMAAQHSLNHKELWMKPGTYIGPKSIMQSPNIQEQHFISFDAKNLSQTETFRGQQEKTYRELERIITDPKYSGIYTFVMDELYSALSKSDDAADAWAGFKGYMAPTPHIKVIGTFASEDLEKFKEGKSRRDGDEYYGEQMQRRMPPITMRDYNREEGYRLLENGFNALSKKAGLSPQIPDDQNKIFGAILDRAEEATNSAGHIVFGLPSRIEKVLRSAANSVRDRTKKFRRFTLTKESIDKMEGYLDWAQKIIPQIEQEEQAIQEGRGMDSGKLEKEIKNISDEINIAPQVSFRDVHEEFPAGEIDSPEQVEESKGEKINALETTKQAVQSKLTKIKRALRIKKLELQQGVNSLRDKFGDIFREDFSDIGNVKAEDIENIAGSSLIMAEAKK